MGHLLHCSVAKMQQAFAKGVQRLQEWMQSGSHPAIVGVLGHFVAAQGGCAYAGGEIPLCLGGIVEEQDQIR